MKLKKIIALVASLSLIVTMMAGCSEPKVVVNKADGKDGVEDTANPEAKGTGKLDGAKDGKKVHKELEGSKEQAGKVIGGTTSDIKDGLLISPNNNAGSKDSAGDTETGKYTTDFNPSAPFQLVEVETKEGDTFNAVGIDTETDKYYAAKIGDTGVGVYEFFIENVHSDSKLLTADVLATTYIFGGSSKTATENREYYYNMILSQSKSAFNSAEAMNRGRVFKTYSDDNVSIVYTEVDTMSEKDNSSYRPFTTVTAVYELDSYHVLQVRISSNYFVYEGEDQGMSEVCESMMNDVLAAYPLSDIKEVATDLEV